MSDFHAPMSDPEPENRCPDGECVSIAHADPNANKDRDSYWTCAHCDGDLCSACNSRPAPYLGAFCDHCGIEDDYEDVALEKQPAPSEVDHTPWIWAETPGGRERRGGSDQGGKWMIFAESWAEHDANWARIVGALDRLGGVAKASTRYREPREHGAIMVYTRDADDVRDVQRVLGVLRDLGFDGWLNYKADATTMSLVYRQGTASYTSPPNSRGMRDKRRAARARVAEVEAARADRERPTDADRRTRSAGRRPSVPR